MTQADRILLNVYRKLNPSNSTDEAKYKRINDIVDSLQRRNRKKKINGKTTGTISERLCELALKASKEIIYKSISKTWNWMTDFSISGHPFNILVSVKSFKAKERLLVSGSGNILSPTVGWALFDDVNEWNEQRTRIYLYRSFIAIYVPANLYRQISKEAKAVRNINGKPFLRKMEKFMLDLRKAADLETGFIDVLAF